MAETHEEFFMKILNTLMEKRRARWKGCAPSAMLGLFSWAAEQMPDLSAQIDRLQAEYEALWGKDMEAFRKKVLMWGKKCLELDAAYFAWQQGQEMRRAA